MRLLATMAIALAMAVTPGSGRAQTAQDTLAVELAMAKYLRPTVDNSVRLEPRLDFPDKDHPSPPEYVNAPAIARALGIKTVHIEDAFHCDAHCTAPGVKRVLLVSPPWIRGDSAQITVSFREELSPVRDYDGGDIYALKRVHGIWHVIRSFFHRVS